jgi:hypothetical protein
MNGNQTRQTTSINAKRWWSLGGTFSAGFVAAIFFGVEGVHGTPWMVGVVMGGVLGAYVADRNVGFGPVAAIFSSRSDLQKRVALKQQLRQSQGS